MQPTGALLYARLVLCSEALLLHFVSWELHKNSAQFAVIEAHHAHVSFFNLCAMC